MHRLSEWGGKWEQSVNLGKSGHPLRGLSLPTCRMGVGMDEMTCQGFVAQAF